MLLKVGELAKRTGLTVRTLHHYDAIGLLKPSARSDAGYRLYNQADIARLHGIQGLRNLGLALSDIDRLLALNGASLPEIIARQMLALDQEIVRATDLRSRLGLLQDGLRIGNQPETDDWLAALERMSMHGKYFNATELRFIREGWKKLETEWQPLIKEVLAASVKHHPPDSPEAQRLARRWMDLSMRWMNDDVDLLHRWGDMCKREPAAHGKSGIDSESYAYIGKAIDLRVAVFQKYLTIDEIKRLKKDMDWKWEDLDKAARKIMKAKLPPESAEAQQLFVQWSVLVDETCDHDPIIREKFLNAVRSEPLIQAGSPLSVESRQFIRAAHLARMPVASAG